MLYKQLKKIKFSWYWSLCYIPILIGLTLVILAVANVIEDRVNIDGILIENGFRTFTLGLMLLIIGIGGIILVIISKKIHSIYKKKFL